jgi:hypothetical protein
LREQGSEDRTIMTLYRSSLLRIRQSFIWVIMRSVEREILILYSTFLYDSFNIQEDLAILSLYTTHWPCISSL